MNVARLLDMKQPCVSKGLCNSCREWVSGLRQHGVWSQSFFWVARRLFAIVPMVTQELVEVSPSNIDCGLLPVPYLVEALAVSIPNSL